MARLIPANWTQGVGVMDAVAAAAGLAAATLIPPMIIKASTTTTEKLERVGISIASAIVVGIAAKSVFKNNQSAAKAAVIGGLAGAAAQVLNMFAGVKITGNSSIRSLPMGRVGETSVVFPRSSRDGETVNMIQP